VSADPELILWIDGDEVLERSGPALVRGAVGRSRRFVAYSLRVAYAWHKPEQFRVDVIYGNFRRPSLFRIRGSYSNLAFSGQRVWQQSALRKCATGFGTLLRFILLPSSYRHARSNALLNGRLHPFFLAINIPAATRKAEKGEILIRYRYIPLSSPPLPMQLV
jgi:hypothetical protein